VLDAAKTAIRIWRRLDKPLTAGLMPKAGGSNSTFPRLSAAMRFTVARYSFKRQGINIADRNGA
jgi:hypothetical protein